MKSKKNKHGETVVTMDESEASKLRHATEILCDYLQSIDFTAFNDDDKKVLFELSEIIDL